MRLTQRMIIGLDHKRTSTTEERKEREEEQSTYTTFKEQIAHYKQARHEIKWDLHSQWLLRCSSFEPAFVSDRIIIAFNVVCLALV